MLLSPPLFWEPRSLRLRAWLETILMLSPSSFFSALNYYVDTDLFGLDWGRLGRGLVLCLLLLLLWRLLIHGFIK